MVTASSWTPNSFVFLVNSTFSRLIPAASISSSDIWTCIVTPYDASASGVGAQESVSIVSACAFGSCDEHISLDCGIGPDFVNISGDTFTMGSTSSELGRESDEVEHLVSLNDDFFIMTTEVTQAMFEALMGYKLKIPSVAKV